VFTFNKAGILLSLLEVTMNGMLMNSEAM